MTIDNRFTYHPPTADQIVVYQEICDLAKTFAHYLNTHVPFSGELVRSLDALDQVVMLANAAIARYGRRDE